MRKKKCVALFGIILILFLTLFILPELKTYKYTKDTLYLAALDRYGEEGKVVFTKNIEQETIAIITNQSSLYYCEFTRSSFFRNRYKLVLSAGGKQNHLNSILTSSKGNDYRLDIFGSNFNQAALYYELSIDGNLQRVYIGNEYVSDEYVFSSAKFPNYQISVFGKGGSLLYTFS